MFDLFGRNSNDNERDDGRPRIVFANLRRPNRPILTEAGYKVFSATAFSGWALIVFVVWMFRVEVSLSQELMTSLASSSVELSALSLAVLGILHELNKEDKWFKFGLFLISVLFVGVVFGGFFLAFTWQPAFDLPQQIKIVVVAALGVVAIIQIDWKVILRLTRIRLIANLVLPTRVTSVIQRIRLIVPFVLPIFLIWLPDLNRLTAMVVLFAGGLIALVVLMGVTIIFLLTSKAEVEPEDPFISTLRARYENEIKTIIRFGELKARAIDALRNLQADEIEIILEQNSFSRIDKAPQMVEMSNIVERLRRMGITDDKRVIDSVMSSLVDEKVICRESYSGPFWIIPDERLIFACLAHLEELAIIMSQTYNKGLYTVERYNFYHLRDWLSVNMNIPIFVVGEYVMPRVLEHLLNQEHFHIIKKGFLHMFVNKRWKISLDEWESLTENAREGAKQEFERRNETGYRRMFESDKEEFIQKETWFNLLRDLPHTSDADDMVMGGNEIAILESILTR